MTRAAALAALVIAIGVVAGAIDSESARAAPGPAVSVWVDRARVSTSLGRSFSFRTRITNDGTEATPRLVVHLNVLSLTPGTYVDPEDWSSRRTRYLEPLERGSSRTLRWTVKAVNSGPIGVYVAVLPRSGAPVPPATGATVRIEIAKRVTLNPSGVVPLVIGIPALLAALAVSIRVRRHRR